METEKIDGDGEKGLDDGGSMEEADCPGLKPPEPRTGPPATLLDLSDDVLLLILRYCRPRDLKALGFTCPRLGRLIRDRTLWVRVDARGQPTGRARLRWLLAHALNTSTTELHLHGFAREGKGCLGHMNRKRAMQAEGGMVQMNPPNRSAEAGPSRNGPAQIIGQMDPLSRLQLFASDEARPRNSNLQPPNRFGASPSWPDTLEDVDTVAGPELMVVEGSCPGPQFTLTQCMLRQLRSHCRLTSLSLQYCNINCNTTGIAHFPPTLTHLSLRGSKCYNLPMDKSFLFNIQDYLPELECLDLSDCDWLEPATLLPLSKVTALKHLVMRHCYRLTEFVAYASLATRYGFRNLELLDLRGSPVADSEVSALGWLPSLQELYMSPAPKAIQYPIEHTHYRDEPLLINHELDPWEIDEPEYFKIKPQRVKPMDKHPNMTIDDIEEHIEQLRDYENNICLHGIEYNLCTEGIRRVSPKTKPKKVQKKDEIPTDEEVDIMNVTPTDETDLKQSQIIKRKIASEIEEKPKRPKVDIPAKYEFKDQPQPSCSSKPFTDSTPSRDKKPKNPNDSDTPDDDNVPLEMICETTVEKDPKTSADIENTVKTEESCQNNVKKDAETAGKSDSETKPADSKEKAADSKEKPAEEGPANGPEDPQSRCRNPEEHPKDCKCKERKVYEFVRFRQNMDPVIVRRDAAEVDQEQRDIEAERAENNNREARPRAHVLYVNVGQQLHTVYRLSLHNEPPIFYSFAGNNHLRFRPNVGNSSFNAPTPHLDATSLVSDSAVRRFGRADVDDIAYVHIGPRNGEPGARPNRSRLRILSITGFRNITDRSLVHLATAAPDLEEIDFSETRVTAQGVENFKSVRPDCEVKFSPFKDDVE